MNSPTLHAAGLCHPETCLWCHAGPCPGVLHLVRHYRVAGRAAPPARLTVQCTRGPHTGPCSAEWGTAPASRVRWDERGVWLDIVTDDPWELDPETPRTVATGVRCV